MISSMAYPTHLYGITRRLIASKFVRHGLNKQIGIFARVCIPYQTSIIYQHIKALFQTFHVPGRHSDHIHIDLAGPLSPSKGFTHLLTVVDRFTGWPEAIPLRDTSTVTCDQALVMHWISRFGVPVHITSDRGTQITPQLWASMAQF